VPLAVVYCHAAVALTGRGKFGEIMPSTVHASSGHHVDYVQWQYAHQNSRERQQSPYSAVAILCLRLFPAQLDLCKGLRQVVWPNQPSYLSFLALDLQVFSLIVLIELFGSPFMRSAALVIALLVGTGVAAVATVDGNRFFNGKNVQSAPAITFLWVKRFPLGELGINCCSGAQE